MQAAVAGPGVAAPTLRDQAAKVGVGQHVGPGAGGALVAQGNLSLTGKTLEKIVRRIKMQTPIEGANLRLEETNAGILLHADQQAEVAPTVAINHDFKATSPAFNTLDISAGKVYGVDWGTPSMSNPLPTNWLAQQASIGPSTLSVASGSSVWLRIQLSQVDVNMSGALSATGATTLSVTTGGGGAGGSW